MQIPLQNSSWIDPLSFAVFRMSIYVYNTQCVFESTLDLLLSSYFAL